MFRKQAPSLLQMMVMQLAVKGADGNPTEAGAKQIKRDINEYFHRLVCHIFLSSARIVTKLYYSM